MAAFGTPCRTHCAVSETIELKMSFVLVMAVQHEADGDMRDERLKSERRWAAKHSSVTLKSESDV